MLARQHPCVGCQEYKIHIPSLNYFIFFLRRQYSYIKIDNAAGQFIMRAY